MEQQLHRDLLTSLRRLPGVMRYPAKSRYRDYDVLAVLLWAVLHDRPISWATRRANWPIHDRRRPLPSDATMSRRLRAPRINRILRELIASMRGPDAQGLTLILDGRPLTIARHSRDRDARFGRAAGGMGKGYKLHEIVDAQGFCVDFRVTPLNVHELHPAAEMIAQLPIDATRWLLADSNYDVNRLYELAGGRGVQMLAARRTRARGLGHRRHSVYRLDAIELLEREPQRLDPRRFIETCFAIQGNVVGGLGPLPNHVRNLHRVERWVAAKLAIDAVHRRRRQPPNNGP